MSSRTPRVVTRLAALLLAAAVLAACGGQPSDVTWRNIDVDLPDGWYVFEQTDDLLSISNVDLATYAEEGEFPDDDVVAMYFSHEPGALPDQWRGLIDERGAILETDDRLELDGEVPATRLVYTDTSANVPTREMVVLIPSRQVVVLAHPVPRPGQQDAPELFLEHVDTFLEVLHTARLGRPMLDE